jgi:hypothetical protein
MEPLVTDFTRGPYHYRQVERDAAFADAGTPPS